MISLRMLVMSVLCAAFFCPLVTAQDLARYRDFQFGMSLGSVVEQLHLKSTDARTIHQRPAVIQTLQWDQFRYSELPVKADSLRNVRFDFYGGGNFKKGVSYEPLGAEGVSTDDTIETISFVCRSPTQTQRGTPGFRCS